MSSYCMYFQVFHDGFNLYKTDAVLLEFWAWLPNNGVSGAI